MSNDTLLAARTVIEEERLTRATRAAEELGAFIKDLKKRYNVEVSFVIESVEIAPGVYGQRAYQTLIAKDTLDNKRG